MEDQHSPKLRLDSAASNATAVLLPLAIASNLSSSLTQPIQVEWLQGIKDSVELQEPQESAASVTGVDSVSKWLLNRYADTGIVGTDPSQSTQVNAQ